MLKYILAWKVVKSIFDNAKSFDWNNNKAFFRVDEEMLKTLFPKEYAKSKERAEKNV